MASNTASSSSSAWYFLHELFVSCQLPHWSANDFEEESIFSNQAKTLLYLQYGKVPANIDFIYFTNKGVNPRHRKSRPGIPRDSPIGLFCILPEPLPITSCVKTYETYEMELGWLLLLADIFRRQNIEVNKCDRFCPRNFIAWSLDMSREFPWQLDYTPCCETIYKNIALFLRFFCHISSLREVQ